MQLDSVLKKISSDKASKKKKNLTPYLFLSPSLIIVGLVVVIPILFSFGISFFQFNLNLPGFGFKFVGLGNYLYIFQDKEMISSILWTFEFTILAVSIELVLGMIFAQMLNSKLLGKARDALRGVFLVPIMFSGVVTGWMWRLMFDSTYGPVNHFLSLWGIEKIPWGANLLTARSMILITDIWLATPFVMLILLAGLQNIPTEMLEAASIDGASNWQKFTRIVLPLLKFPIMVVVVIRTMDGLRVFDLVRVLTRGGPGISSSTIMYYIYQYAFSYFQIGRAAAMSFSFMILIFLITYLYIRLLRREAAY